MSVLRKRWARTRQRQSLDTQSSDLLWKVSHSANNMRVPGPRERKRNPSRVCPERVTLGHEHTSTFAHSLDSDVSWKNEAVMTKSTVLLIHAEALTPSSSASAKEVIRAQLRTPSSSSSAKGAIHVCTCCEYRSSTRGSDVLENSERSYHHVERCGKFAQTASN